MTLLLHARRKDARALQVLSCPEHAGAAQPTPEQPFVSLLPARPAAAAKKVPRSVKMLSIGNLQDVDAKLLEPRVSVR